MWRAFLFLLVLFPFSGFANCVSADQVTKCARLPENEFYYTLITDRRYDDSSWGGAYNGHVLDGYGVLTGDRFNETKCVITSPFVAEGLCYGSPMTTSDANYNCGTMSCDIGIHFGAVTQLSGDECPDGFYTVPYDVSCGAGLVEIADIPQCNSDTSGDFCLIGGVLIAPCAAGITTVRTGTGVVVPLWAEKSTQPSLCVKYNDNICYANLEAGQATDAINVNYDGVVYHTVD